MTLLVVSAGGARHVPGVTQGVSWIARKFVVAGWNVWGVWRILFIVRFRFVSRFGDVFSVLGKRRCSEMCFRLRYAHLLRGGWACCFCIPIDCPCAKTLMQNAGRVRLCSVLCAFPTCSFLPSFLTAWNACLRGIIMKRPLVQTCFVGPMGVCKLPRYRHVFLGNPLVFGYHRHQQG